MTAFNKNGFIFVSKIVDTPSSIVNRALVTEKLGNYSIDSQIEEGAATLDFYRSQRLAKEKIFHQLFYIQQMDLSGGKTQEKTEIKKQEANLKNIGDLMKLYQDILENAPTLQDVKTQAQIKEIVQPEKLVDAFENALPVIEENIRAAFTSLKSTAAQSATEQEALKTIEKKVMDSLTSARGIVAAIKLKNKDKSLDIRDFDGFLDHFKNLMNDLDDFYIRYYELSGEREDFGGNEKQLAIRSILSQTLALASVGYVGYTVLTNPNSAVGQGMGIATFLSLVEFAKSSYFFQGLLNDKSKFSAMQFGGIPYRYVERPLRDSEGRLILDKKGEPKTEKIKTIDYANMPTLGLDRYRNTGMPELSSVLAGIRDNLRNLGYRQEILNDDAKNINGDPNYGDQKELRFTMAQINRFQELVATWKKEQKISFRKEERALADLVFDLSTLPEFNFTSESVILDEGQDLGIDSGKLSRVLTHLGNRGGEIAMYSSISHFLLDEFTGEGKGLKQIASHLSEEQKQKIENQIKWMVEQLAIDMSKFNVRKFVDSDYIKSLFNTLIEKTAFEHGDVLMKIFESKGESYFNEYVKFEATKAGVDSLTAEKLGKAILRRAKEENVIPQIATLSRLASEGILKTTDRNTLAHLLSEKYKISFNQALDLVSRIEKSGIAELSRKDSGSVHVEAEAFSKVMHWMQYTMQIGMDDLNTGEDTLFTKDRIRFLAGLFQKKDSELKENIQTVLGKFIKAEKINSIDEVINDIKLFKQFVNHEKGGKSLSKPIQQYLNDYRDWHLWQRMNGSENLDFDLLKHLQESGNKVELKDRFAGLFEYILGNDKKTAELLSHYLGDQVAKNAFSGTAFEAGIQQKMSQKKYSFDQARLELWQEYKSDMETKLNQIMDQIDNAFKLASKNDKGEMEDYRKKINEVLSDKKVNKFFSDKTQEILNRSDVSPISELQRKEILDAVFEELDRAHNKLFRSAFGHYSLRSDITGGVIKFVHSLKAGSVQAEMGQGGGQKRPKNHVYLNRLLKENNENSERLNQIKERINNLLKANPQLKISAMKINQRLEHLFNVVVGRGVKRMRYKDNFNRELEELESLLVDVFFGKQDLTVLQPLNIDRNEHTEIRHLLVHKDGMSHTQFQKIHSSSALKGKTHAFHQSLISKEDYAERRRHYQFLTGKEGEKFKNKCLEADISLVQAAIEKREDQIKVANLEKEIVDKNLKTESAEKNLENELISKDYVKRLEKLKEEKKLLEEYLEKYLKSADVLSDETMTVSDELKVLKEKMIKFEVEGIGQLERFKIEKAAYVSQMEFLVKIQESDHAETFQNLKSLMRELIQVHAKDNELVLDLEENIRQISTGSDKQKDYEEKLRFLKNEHEKVSHELFEYDKRKETAPEALHLKLKTIQDQIILYQANIFEAPTMNNRFHFAMATKILKITKKNKPQEGDYVKELIDIFEAENGKEIKKLSLKVFKYDRTPYGPGLIDDKKKYKALSKYADDHFSSDISDGLWKQYKKISKKDTGNLYGLGTHHHEDPKSERLFHRYVVEQNMSYLHGTYGGTKAHQAAAHAGGENVNQIVFQRFNATVDQFLHPELTLNPPRLVSELQNNFLARIAFAIKDKKIDYTKDEEYRLENEAFADDVVEKIKKYRYTENKSQSETVKAVMDDLLAGVTDEQEKKRIVKEMNINRLALEKITAEVAILMEASSAAVDYKALYVAQGLIDSPKALPEKALKALEKAKGYFSDVKKYKPLKSESEIKTSLLEIKKAFGEYWKVKKAELIARNWSNAEIKQLEETLEVRRRHIEGEIEQKQAFAQNSLKALMDAKDRIVDQIKEINLKAVEESFAHLLKPFLEQGILIDEKTVLTQMLEKHLTQIKDTKQRDFIKNVIEESYARLKLELVELREILDYDRIHVGAWYGIGAQFHPDSKYLNTKKLSTYVFKNTGNQLTASRTGSFNFSTYREITKMALGEQMMVRRELYMLPPGESYSLEELTALSLSLADRPLYHKNLGKVKELGMAQMKMARLVDRLYAQNKISREASASEQKKQIFELLQAYQIASRVTPETEKELLSPVTKKKILESYQNEKIEQMLSVLGNPQAAAQIEYQNFLQIKAQAFKNDPELHQKMLEAQSMGEARKLLAKNSKIDEAIVKELKKDLDKLSAKLDEETVLWAKNYYFSQIRHFPDGVVKKINKAATLQEMIDVLNQHKEKLSVLNAKDEKKYLAIINELEANSLNPYQFTTLDLLQMTVEAAEDLKKGELSFQDLTLMPTLKVSNDIKNGFNQDLVEMIAGTWFHIDVTEELDTDNFPFDSAKNRALRHFKKRHGVIMRKEDATLQTSQYFFGPEKRLRGQGLMGEIFRRVMGRGFDQGTYYEDGRMTRLLAAMGLKPAHHGTRGGLALIMGCFIHKAHHAFDRASYFTRIPIFERPYQTYFLEQFTFKGQESGGAPSSFGQGIGVYNKLRYYTAKALPITALVASGAFSFVSSFGFQLGDLGLPGLSTLGLGLVASMSLGALGVDPRLPGVSGKISSAFYAFKDSFNQRNAKRLLWVLGGITALLANTLPFNNYLTETTLPAFSGAMAMAVGALSGMLAGMISLPSVTKNISANWAAKRKYKKAFNQRVADGKNLINQDRIGFRSWLSRFSHQARMQSPIYFTALAVAVASGIVSGGVSMPLISAILGGGILVTGLQIHRPKALRKFLTRVTGSKVLLDLQNAQFLRTRITAALKIFGLLAASAAVFPVLGTSMAVVGTVMMFNAVMLPSLIYQFNKDSNTLMPTNRWLQKSIGMGIGAMGASWIAVGALGVSSPLLGPLAALTALTALLWIPDLYQKNKLTKVSRLWLGEYDYPVEKDSEDAMMTLYIKLLGYNLRYHDFIDGPSSGVNSEPAYKGQRYRWNTGNILLKGAMERAWAHNPQALSIQNISRMNHVVGTSAYAIQKYTLNTLMMMLAVGGMPAFSFGYTDQFINPLKTFIGINLANYLVFMNNFNSALVKEGASKRQINEMFGTIDMMTDVNHTGYISRGIFREDADFSATKAPPIAVKTALMSGKMFKSFYGYGGTLGLSSLMTSLFVIGSVFGQGSFYGIPMALLLFWNYRPLMNVYHALFKISRQGREEYGEYTKGINEQNAEIKKIAQREKIIEEFEKENLSKSPVLNVEILSEYIQFNKLRESFYLNSVKQAFHRQVEMKETQADFSVAAAWQQMGFKNLMLLKINAFTGWRMDRLISGFKKHRKVFRKHMQIGRYWFVKSTFWGGYRKAAIKKTPKAIKKWAKNLRKKGNG